MINNFEFSSIISNLNLYNIYFKKKDRTNMRYKLFVIVLFDMLNAAANCA